MNFFDVLIVQPIFNLLILLYAIVPWSDFGVAIILFTIIVRFVLYPLTRSMFHQSRAMRKLQPQLTKIRKQTKGNRQAMGLQTMELYKQHGIKPFRQIGILLIQLPIFIALFHVINIFTLHRDQIEKFTYDILEGLEPIKQIIANPDNFNEKLFGIVDLASPGIGANGINIPVILLVALAAVSQYIVTKQTMPQHESTRRLRDIMAEAAEGKEADQAEMNAIVMQKMMKVLPILLFFVMIGLPGALSLYSAVSSLVAAAQQYYLLKQDEETLEDMAEKGYKKEQSSHKKATQKAREKAAKPAKITNEASVTRISAKDTGRKSK